jgi:Type I phosphodiesterase / nucleotide pyrophosphatase
MKRYLTKPVMGAIFLLAVCLVAVPAFLVVKNHVSASNQANSDQIRHVLLLSIDGMHEQDLARYTQLHPNSALAQLTHLGITYTNASSSKPSDSFPGLLSMVTGGTPRSTGVFYDDSYDRNLSAPSSNCATKGTEVVYDESIDIDPTRLDAGGGIDPKTLPLDGSKGCTPVYPHSFLRVNTIFEVAQQAGLYTAWSDKHPAYDLVNGPSGKGVADLYTPEIAAVPVTVSDTETYDDLKVQAILNEIAGKDHTGTKTAPVPAIFGMNFQAVNVGQKDANGGYLDADATPSPLLQGALDHTDQSVRKMLDALSNQDLLSSTTIILSAKHGQSPIDPTKHLIVNKAIIPNLVNSVQSGLLAQATEDDVALLWLTDQSKVNDVVTTLNANKAQAHIDTILSGDSLKQYFNDPTTDSRTPDIIVLPEHGVIYAKPTATKIAEHGGFTEDDTHVSLFVANPHLQKGSISTSVQTTQIAPTILHLLQLDPNKLQAVSTENTQILPGIDQ